MRLHPQQIYTEIERCRSTFQTTRYANWTTT